MTLLLDTGPHKVGRDSADWHVEVFPRLTVVAGVELGSGWAINPLAPEDAAGQLRD